MNPVRTQIRFPPSHRSVIRAFRTGVSLHSLTEFSEEDLGGLPRHLERIPVVSHFLRREMERYRAKTGQPVDSSRAYWRGPLDARSAHDLEKRRIAAAFFELYDDLHRRFRKLNDVAAAAQAS